MDSGEVAGLKGRSLASARRRLVLGLKIAPSGCWEWSGAKYPAGYGSIMVGSKFDQTRGPVPTHRLAYELEMGSIPDGLQIDHLCRNRACANVLHLEVVTPGENVRRGNGLAGVNARKTECIHGHPLDAVNTYVGSDGKRVCRACKRNTWRRWRARHPYSYWSKEPQDVKRKRWRERSARYRARQA
ncbi:hypothetical protein LCGC14_1134530 [marine sediment metagenome]|uniref:HNH nuclease domain-containing protein n=2 Tax=marine sediment metagenome TaxID=412755 RepID=A0A0F9PIF4_9ZZZZ